VVGAVLRVVDWAEVKMARVARVKSGAKNCMLKCLVEEGLILVSGLYRWMRALESQRE
jgi:hypothetical protein